MTTRFQGANMRIVLSDIGVAVATAILYLAAGGHCERLASQVAVRGCYTLAAVELWCYDGEHEEFVAVASEEDHTANNEAASEWYAHVG